MSRITINRKNQKRAREYFGIFGDRSKILHHIDESLMFTDPFRYNEGRPEDLVVLTVAEHNSLHKKGSKLSEEARNNISSGCKGRKKTNTGMESHRQSMIKNGHWKA